MLRLGVLIRYYSRGGALSRDDVGCGMAISYDIMGKYRMKTAFLRANGIKSWCLMLHRHRCRLLAALLLVMVMPDVLHAQGLWVKKFLPTPAGTFAVAPSVAIDSGGNVHLSYVVYKRPFIRPTTYPRYGFGYDQHGSWGDSIYLYWSRWDCVGASLTRTLDSGRLSSESAIAAGQNGEVEIGYVRGDSSAIQFTDLCEHHVRMQGGVWGAAGRIVPGYCTAPSSTYIGERYPAISLDSNRRLHTVHLVDSFQVDPLQYRDRSIAGVWSGRIRFIGTRPYYATMHPSIDARNGKAHVAFLKLERFDTASVQYSSGDINGFGGGITLVTMPSTYLNLFNSPGLIYRPMYAPCIAVDSSDACHVIFARQFEAYIPQRPKMFSTSALYYMNNVGGTWSAPQRISDTAIWGNASLAFDRRGKLHVVAERRDTAAGSTFEVMYLNNNSGSWSTPQNLTNNAVDDFLNADGGRFLAIDGERAVVSYYTFEADTTRPQIGLLMLTLCGRPPLVITPRIADLGNVPVGMCRDTVVELRAGAVVDSGVNKCVVALQIDSLRFIDQVGRGGRFEIVGTNVRTSLVSGGRITRTLRFCATDTGCVTARIEVCRRDGLDTITLRACGLGPRLELRPRRINFDSVAIGTCRDTSFTIANIGGDTLHTGRPRLIGGRDTTWFKILAPVDSSHLRALQTRAGRIRFCPLDTGCFMVRLVVGSRINNDTVEVVGCAIAPRPSIAPDTIDLGRVLVGSCRDTTVTVRNTGGGWLLAPGATSVGALLVSITPSDSLRVAPGGSTSLRLRWCPPDTGCVTGRVVLKTIVGDRVVFVRGCGVAPRIICEPTEIDFGGVPVDSCREASVVLRNSGGYVLEIASGSLGGTPGVTLVSPTQWPQRLQPGDSLSVVVRYCPTTTDTLNEALTFINDSRNSPVHVVRVKGYGARGKFSLPPRIDFGVVPIGTCKDTMIVARNSGNAALDLDAIVVRQLFGDRGFTVAAVTPSPRRLTPGDTLQVRLRYCPKGTTGDRDSLGITSRPTTRGVELVGRGTRGTLVSDALRIDFGDIELGQCKRDSIHLQNIGSVSVRLLQGDLTAISGGAAPGSMKIITPTSYPIDVAAGASITVVFEYCPTQEVSDSAMWHGVVENDPDGIIVEVRGRGVRSGIEVTPDTLEFGCVEPGRVVGRAVHVRNVGSRSLLINTYRITSAGSPYLAPTGQSIPVGVGTERVDSIYYIPPTVGEFTSELEVTTDAGVQRVVLHGRSGRDTALRITPEDLTFGTIGVGDTAVACVEIWNITCDAVTISSITPNGRGYLLSGDNGATRTLASGERDTICIAYAPDTVGVSDGRLQVDAGLRSGSVGLHGVGAPAGVVARPRTMDFGRVDVGGSVGPREGVIFNQGLVDVDATNWQITGANPGDFTAPPFVASTTLGANGRDTLRLALRFVPTTRGIRTARLEVETSSGARVGVDLRGYGDEFSVSSTPLVVDAGRVATGSTATLVDTIHLRGSGTRLGRITAIRLTGPDSSYFTVSGIAVNDAVDTSIAARATVTFTPDAVRHYSAQWIAEVDGNLRSSVDLLGEGIGGRVVRLVLDTVRAHVGERFILRGYLIPGLTVEEKATGWRAVLRVNPKSLYPHSARDAGGNAVSLGYDASGRIELTSNVELVGSRMFDLELEGLASGQRSNAIAVEEATLDSGIRVVLHGFGLVELEGCDIDRGVGFDRRARIIGVRPQPSGGESLEVGISGGSSGGARLRLVDLLGRVIVEEAITATNPDGNQWQRFELGGVSSGMYLLEVVDGGWVDARLVMVGG